MSTKARGSSLWPTRETTVLTSTGAAEAWSTIENARSAAAFRIAWLPCPSWHCLRVNASSVEPRLAGRLRIGANEIQVFANDRLAAPNTDQTFERFLPALEQLLEKLYPGDEFTLSCDPDPKERFSVTAGVTGPQSTTSLLGRLAI